MFLKLTALSKPEVTQVTYERFTTLMNSQMIFKITIFLELFIAFVANISAVLPLSERINNLPPDKGAFIALLNSGSLTKIWHCRVILAFAS
jgi:hypothetical protein